MRLLKYEYLHSGRGLTAGDFNSQVPWDAEHGIEARQKDRHGRLAIEWFLKFYNSSFKSPERE